MDGILWCLDNCASWTAVTPFPAKSRPQLISIHSCNRHLRPRRASNEAFGPLSYLLRLEWQLFLASREAFGSFVAVGVVAAADMVIWISVILTLAGPMILSGIEAMHLDFVSIKALQSTGIHNFTQVERVSISVAILCRNFDDHGNYAATTLQTTLSSHAAGAPGIPPLETRKAQLSAIMNGQASFGSAVGIATLFFLVGFLYNALGITDDTIHGITWTSYAIWLMSMAFAAVVSATLLIGNNASVATVLVGTDYHLQDHYILADYYEGELYPVSMYERGIRKMSWLQQSQRHDISRCLNSRSI